MSAAPQPEVASADASRFPPRRFPARHLSSAPLPAKPPSRRPAGLAMFDANFFLNCFISLLAVVNPFGALPFYAAAISNTDAHIRRRVALVTTTTILVTLLGFQLSGTMLLELFGISMAAFRTAGGLLLMAMAFAMLHGQTSRVKHVTQEVEVLREVDSMAVVPLAIPMLAGPGAISTVVLFSHRSDSVVGQLMVTAAVLLTALVTYLFLRLAEPLIKRLGQTGVRIATRVFGMLIAAVAIQFMADGLSELFPGLKG
jgi:multiple antibiotic resistance protein